MICVGIEFALSNLEVLFRNDLVQGVRATGERFAGVTMAG